MVRFLILLLLLATSATSPTLQIGMIDFYGLRRVSEREVRQALQITEGDPVPESVEAAERRLNAVPGVVKARVTRLCCEDGKAILYVGIEEKSSPFLQFRPAPRGTIRLPDEIVQAEAALDKALSAAVQRGDVGEDDSQGHALSRDPAARAIQERFVGYATRGLARLRDVLRHSGDGEQRALAAEVLAYAPDKQAIVGDLVRAMRDPAEGVRNNAMRALGVLARYSLQSPRSPLRIPARPFVDLLNSPVWTDRNKAASALTELSTQRDPALLRALREQALPSLIEMARWKSPGHRNAAFWLLGRVGDLSDDAISTAWSRRDVDQVISAALNTKHPLHQPALRRCRST
jgi:HEAT repeat protein